MRSRDRTALALAPVFLRLALAVTFLWAGLSKFMERDEFSGEDAAILANYGVIPNPHRAGGPPTLPDPPAEEIDPQSAAGRRPAPAIRLATWQPEDAPQTEPPAEPDTETPPAQRESAAPETAPAPRVLATADDFPEPVSARRYAQLVLLLHRAIHPGLDPEDSSPRRQLWPDIDRTLDYDPWPVWAARAVALTEVIGGILVAIGLLTRLAALALAGVMLGALWLTTIGPAIQSGNTVLGVLPDYPRFDPAWQTPLMQFIVLCMALALFFAGPGTLSLDRLLLGGPARTPPAKPAPAPAPPKK
ncbi:MAG TPA: DoxX family membrane protein [Phycisphaerales bacterium]|nr:DoxX family membrane protein [Phycisphaerales bacterium]